MQTANTRGRIEEKVKEKGGNQQSRRGKPYKYIAILSIIEKMNGNQARSQEKSYKNDPSYKGTVFIYMNPIIHTILASTQATLPIVIDEDGALEIVSSFSGIHITTLDACTNGSLPGISLYERDVEEDKKHLSIKDIRRWLGDIAEIPYESKHIYILRDFDDASLEAMNATLKILEEPPLYAIILLIVKNPESLIETIHSRTVNLFVGRATKILDIELLSSIKSYINGDKLSLISYIYKEKIEPSQAIAILLELGKYSDKRTLESIEVALASLFTINETPRNILDRVIPLPL